MYSSGLVPAGVLTPVRVSEKNTPVKPTKPHCCLAALALSGALGPTSCTSNCSTWVVTIFLEDQSTGDFLCNARVTFGVGDAGTVISASVAPIDAEVPSSSSLCQWDVVVVGGNYLVTASTPGFGSAVATVTLPTDECGTATAPVKLLMVRSTGDAGA